MFNDIALHADLDDWTAEEIALAKEIHDKECMPNCTFGPYAGVFSSDSWLDWARRQIGSRPQKEVLF